MCNLYTERLSAAEVAAHFGVDNPVASNAGEEVYPGATGLVVREAEGRRILQTMTWGWPMKFKGMSEAASPSRSTTSPIFASRPGLATRGNRNGVA